MANIVDELVVTLGLDPSGFKRGRVDTETELKAVSNAAARTGKDLEASGTQGAEFFAKMKNEALGLIGVLMGATGLGAVIRGAATDMAELGRQAAVMNVDPQRLSAYGMAMQRFGASADSTRDSLQGIGGAIERFKLTGQGDIGRWLPTIGASIDNSPFEILEKFNAFAVAHRNQGQLVAQVGQGLGLDQSTIQASLQIRSMAQFQGELNDAMKDSPTAQETKNAQALGAAWARAEQAADGLANKVTSDLSPALEHVLKWGTDEIQQHPQLMEAILAVSTALGSIAAIRISANLLGLTELGKSIAAVESAAISLMTKLSIWATVASLGGDTADNPDAKVPSDPQTSPNLLDRNGAVGKWWAGHAPSWAGGGGSQPNISPQEAKGNRQAIEDYFLGQGYTPNQVAGILANVSAESSFSTKADNGTHAGLFQWDAGRQAQFQGMFHKRVQDATALEQAQFAQWELTHTEKAAGDALRGTSTAFGAGRAFSLGFERPGTGIKGELIADYRGGQAGSYDVHPSQMVAPVAPANTTTTTNNNVTVTAPVTVNTPDPNGHAVGRAAAQAIVTQVNRGLS